MVRIQDIHTHVVDKDGNIQFPYLLETGLEVIGLVRALVVHQEGTDLDVRADPEDLDPSLVQFRLGSCGEDKVETLLAQGEGDALADAIRRASDQRPSVPTISLKEMVTLTEEELVERGYQGEEFFGEEQEAD